jgi:hypothetical protein
MHSKAVHLPEKSVINMILLLLPVCNWPGGPADWGRSVAISSLPSICSPSFSFMGGAGKKKGIKARM